MLKPVADVVPRLINRQVDSDGRVLLPLHPCIIPFAYGPRPARRTLARHVTICDISGLLFGAASAEPDETSTCPFTFTPRRHNATTEWLPKRRLCRRSSTNI